MAEPWAGPAWARARTSNDWPTRSSLRRSMTDRSGRSSASWSRAGSAAGASRPPCSRPPIAHARDHGATVLEAYPVDVGDGRIPSANAYHGTLSMFRRAGFEVVAVRRWNEASPERPIVRLELEPELTGAWPAGGPPEPRPSPDRAAGPRFAKRHPEWRKERRRQPKGRNGRSQGLYGHPRMAYGPGSPVRACLVPPVVAYGRVSGRRAEPIGGIGPVADGLTRIWAGG